MTPCARGVIAGFVLVSGMFWPMPLSARAGSQQQQPGKINRVEFRTLDGQTLRLEDLAGKVVLLDFWATWCAPCLAEMPRLKKLHARYTREDFMIIGISLDTIDRRTFTSWLRRNRIDWPQVQDGRGYNGDLAREFDVQKLPVTVLLDKEGKVARRDVRGQALEAAVAQLTQITRSPDRQITKSTTHRGTPR